VKSPIHLTPASPSVGSAFAGKFIHWMNFLIRLTQLSYRGIKYTI